jgi:uracil-DNA glycosylase family 4
MTDELQLDVMGEGNPNAQIAIVGEAPGEQEHNAKRPFVGPSGQILDGLLKQAGISRSECWVTNVVKYRPPGNNIKKVKNLAAYKSFLINELRTINPRIILALGNIPLQALTGNTGITQWRGSILSCPELGKRVIPTYHPSYLLRSDSIIDKSVAEFDVQRLVEEMSLKPIPSRNLVVIRDSAQLHRYIQKWEQQGVKNVTADIETHKSIPVCLGFGPSRHEAISVPLFNELWGTQFANYPDRELAEFWKMADYILRKFGVIGQNWKFDYSKLYPMGFRVKNFVADTMLMSHTRFPELPKGQAFLASIWTREPFYKLEGKEFNPKKDSSDRLFLYNAKDCAVDYEIFEVLDKELQEFGVRDFYYNFVHHLHNLYFQVEREGIQCDFEKRKELKDKFSELKLQNDKELESIVGRSINVNSSKQVCALLYDELKLPERKGKAYYNAQGDYVQGRTADEDTIIALQANWGERKPKIIPIIDLILKGRGYTKIMGTYIDACPDYDGRYRTNIQIVGTETGRTANKIFTPPSRPEPIGLGFQVIPHDLFEMMVPDDGYYYVECDLSQAEARIVDLLCEDYEGLKEYDTIDKHAKTARIILGLAHDFPITKKSPERFLGKTSRHAGSYDMGKHRAMLTINTDAKKYGINISVSEWRAGKILENFHEAYPLIRKVFHASVQNALASGGRILVNPFGRKRIFGGRWGDQLFKEAYAFIPQSTVGDVVKRAMLYIRHTIPEIRIVMEKHDALGFLIPKAELDSYAKVIKAGLEMATDFSSCSISRGTLVIPCEFEVGDKNLKDLEPYKVAA